MRTTSARRWALLIGVLATLLAVGAAAQTSARARGANEACTAQGRTLAQAQSNYRRNCTQPRVDCDPMPGGWTCSSEQIGNRSPGGNRPRPSTTIVVTTVAPTTVAPSTTVTSSTTITPSTTVAPTTAPPTTAGPNDDHCEARGATLGEARRNYAETCTQPRVDCDPVAGTWICSSKRIGGGGPGSNPTTPTTRPTSPTTRPSTPTTQRPGDDGNDTSGLPPAPAGFRWVRVDAVSDEFNGNSLDRTKWLNDHPYWNGREPSQFLPANVSVGGGDLQLKSTVRNRNQQGNWVNSAAVTSNTKVGQGYYEARIKASRISMTSSFWFQTSGGPRHEIDVIENVGAPRQNPNDGRVMHSNSHYNYGRPNAISTPKRWTMPYGAADDYHVYGVWWKSERDIWIYHNGVKVNEIRTGGPFDANQHMFFDTEVFRWVGNPTVAELDDDDRNTMYVDWVRGWRLVRN